jgi:hypothetical protein
MLRIEDYFEDLYFTECVLGHPLVEGFTITIPIRSLCLIREHPFKHRFPGPMSGRLVFTGVADSERTLIEYIGDPRNPEGYREPYKESDGPFHPVRDQAELSEFSIEGLWESPPAWVHSWVIHAEKFILEIDEVT